MNFQQSCGLGKLIGVDTIGIRGYEFSDSLQFQKV